MGEGAGQLRAALLSLVFYIMVGVGSVLLALMHTGARPWLAVYAMWTVILLAEGWAIARTRQFAIAESRRVADRQCICHRCCYPRVPGISMCPECGSALTPILPPRVPHT